MKKSLIALAVAGAVAAPAAMADVTLYGKVSVDYVKNDTATGDRGRIQRDDTTIGVKAQSETDSGLVVSANIETEDNLTDGVTIGYVAVEGGFGKIWAGKIANPANAVDMPDYSDQLGIDYVPDEIDNTLAYTSPDFGGFNFYAGIISEGRDSVAATAFTATGDNGVSAIDAGNGLVDASASDTGIDASLFGFNFGAAGFTFGAAYHDLDDVADQINAKLGYSMDAFGVGLHYADRDYDAAATSDVDSIGVSAKYTINNTTLSGHFITDDYDSGREDDIWAVKVAQSLGGGAAVYVEYYDLDSNASANDADNLTIGMSYSF